MNQLQAVSKVEVPATITEDIFSRFIGFLDARPKTVETYTRAIRQFYKYISSKEITRPQRADIIAFREELKQDHKPTTVQNYIVAIRLFFQWTEQEGIYSNVAAHIKGAKIDTGHKKDYLTGGQVKTILDSIEKDTVQGLRDYAILVLMITAGLRTIEVSRADIQDLSVSGGNSVLYIQGKGRDEKTEYVKVAEPAEMAIRAYLKARGQASPTAPLFASVSNRDCGDRLTTRSISRAVKERMQSAGFDSERLTAHSLRHTAATLNLINGGSLVETQQLLRHSSINTTMIYNHQLDRAKNNSETRVAKAIFG